MTDQTIAPDAQEQADAAPDTANASVVDGAESVTGQAGAASEGKQTGQADGDKAQGLPEGFKDMASLVKSYNEVRKWAVKVAQENAELKKQTQDAGKNASAEDDDAGKIDAGVIEQIVERALAAKLGNIQGIESRVKEALFNQQVLELAGKYSDFAAISPKVHEVLKERPGLLEQDGGLEVAYWMARGMATHEANQAAAESMAQEVINNQKTKAAATSGGARDTTPKSWKAVEEEIFQRILKAT